jgi:hypothetical protein
MGAGRLTSLTPRPPRALAAASGRAARVGAAGRCWAGQAGAPLAGGLFQPSVGCSAFAVRFFFFRENQSRCTLAA